MNHDTFNTDFYITAATVIPVLYLALTLQGQTFERILHRYEAMSKQGTLRSLSRAVVALIATFAIVILPFIGEWAALRPESASSAVSWLLPW